MNNCIISAILQITNEEAQKYIKNNLYRLTYLFKSKY